ncbi:MAG TPA: hypothetical protein VID47_11700 [Actinomycetota bacterium]|jgi:hypothetical protein
MAIKGKGKTRSTQRTVTRAPKPGYVEPPKPFYQRRWVRWTALGVVVVGVVAIVLSLWFIHLNNSHKRSVEAKAHDKQAKVQEYVAPVVQYLQAVAQPLGGGTEVAAYQKVASQLADLKSGKLSSDDATTIGKNMYTDSSQAAKSIEGLDVPTLVDSARFPDLLDLQDSQELLATSLRLYEQIGHEIVYAASATGDAKANFIQEAERLVPIAAKLFQDGYQKAVNQQIAVGLPPNVFPLTNPTSGPATTGPSPTPSSTPSASPRPSASGGGTPSPSGSATGASGGGGKGGKHQHTPTPSSS